MDLQTQIRPRLWRSIQSTYEAKNYCQAILAAIHYLSDVIRDRSGLDGDGVALVSQALGGESPPLRLNKLQSDTERNEQIGTLNIMRGIYQAIRNPRSHEQVEDSKETADAIIFFVSYLLERIEAAEEPFTVARFQTWVFDDAFVPSDEYAGLLAAQVPKNKLYDTLLCIYREKLTGDVYNVGRVIKALLARFSEDQVNQFVSVVGEELRQTSDEVTIQYNLHLLPPELWGKIPNHPRLRIENKIINNIATGKQGGYKIIDGALATWAREHFRYFSTSTALRKVFLDKLMSGNAPEVRYVVTNFLKWLPTFIPMEAEKPHDALTMQSFVGVIADRIRMGDVRTRVELVEELYALPDGWQDAFANSLTDLTNPEFPLAYTITGRPFLTGDSSIIRDEDIPF